MLLGGEVDGSGEKKVVEAAAQLGIAERLVRVALSFAASYPGQGQGGLPFRS